MKYGNTISARPHANGTAARWFFPQMKKPSSDWHTAFTALANPLRPSRYGEGSPHMVGRSV